MKEHGQWAELAGHDYVMDLIADLELMRDFPKQKSYFIISAESPTKTRPNASLLVVLIEKIIYMDYNSMPKVCPYKI